MAARLGIANVPLDGEAARALEPSLSPVFRHAVHWTGAMSVSNPLALTRAYAARFAALGGITLQGDARSLHRAEPYWRVDTAERPARRRRCGRRTRPVGAGSARSARHQAAARRQARLSPAFSRAGQCRAQPADPRCRKRLLPHADGAGHPAHHRRRVCGARCARRRRCSSTGCCRPRASCSRWASRSRRSHGSARVRALPIHGR